ncbi:MAG: SDR family oxidoreductase [Anaerolineaceae bacterium]|nr:MAG: SDR family oxidoreductase [Anaerolineaceae bacterium]
MQIDLSEQVAVVTGSARRVGKAIALELARAGVNLIIHYHNTDQSEVRDTVQEAKSLGVDAFGVRADISTLEGVHTVFTAAMNHFGTLDILVNSASSFTRNELLDVTLEDWEQSIALNMTAPLLCTQQAARMMLRNTPSGGSIVNILDYGAMRPWLKRVDHGVSKAGLLMLTQVSALSLGKHNIRVNGVLPGPVLQDSGSSDERWREMGEELPIRRTGHPDDVARAVAYLCRESFVTGTVLEVNGGETL